MRTAEEYKVMYDAVPDKVAALGKVAKAFLNETGFEGSRIPVRPSIVPVEELRELLKKQDAKWRKFAELVPGVNPDGYALLLRRKALCFYNVLRHGVFTEEVV